ncbi:unnamed protein product [Coregonus sp. 'balchen']|nr:unnamed protein product [Coregonus sp. 'balchen']
MKYWSCCKKKTSDFNTFLSQEGCSRGNHLWKKKDTVGRGVLDREMEYRVLDN